MSFEGELAEASVPAGSRIMSLGGGGETHPGCKGGALSLAVLLGNGLG